MVLSEAICFRLARRQVINAKRGSAGAHEASFDSAAYRAWRKKELESQFREHFSFEQIRGKDVIDFGCGAGELSAMVSENGAKSVTGIEADPEQYGRA